MWCLVCFGFQENEKLSCGLTLTFCFIPCLPSPEKCKLLAGMWCVRQGVHVIGVRKDKDHSWKRKGLYFGNIDQETAILNPPKATLFSLPRL